MPVRGGLGCRAAVAAASWSDRSAAPAPAGTDVGGGGGGGGDRGPHDAAGSPPSSSDDVPVAVGCNNEKVSRMGAARAAVGARCQSSHPLDVSVPPPPPPPDASDSFPPDASLPSKRSRRAGFGAVAPDATARRTGVGCRRLTAHSPPPPQAGPAETLAVGGGVASRSRLRRAVSCAARPLPRTSLNASSSPTLSPCDGNEGAHQARPVVGAPSCARRQ